MKQNIYKRCKPLLLVLLSPAILLTSNNLIASKAPKEYPDKAFQEFLKSSSTEQETVEEMRVAITAYLFKEDATQKKNADIRIEAINNAIARKSLDECKKSQLQCIINSRNGLLDDFTKQLMAPTTQDNYKALRTSAKYFYKTYLLGTYKPKTREALKARFSRARHKVMRVENTPSKKPLIPTDRITFYPAFNNLTEYLNKEKHTYPEKAISKIQDELAARRNEFHLHFAKDTNQQQVAPAGKATKESFDFTEEKTTRYSVVGLPGEKKSELGGKSVGLLFYTPIACIFAGLLFLLHRKHKKKKEASVTSEETATIEVAAPALNSPDSTPSSANENLDKTA